jgi:hypothetical protein
MNLSVVPVKAKSSDTARAARTVVVDSKSFEKVKLPEIRKEPSFSKTCSKQTPGQTWEPDLGIWPGNP